MLYLKAWYNLGLVRDPFLLVRAQLPIWDTTCAAKITMAPSDRQDKKPKDASPWLWTAPRNSVSLSIHTVCVPTPAALTPSSTRPRRVCLRCVLYCIMQWWSHKTACSESRRAWPHRAPRLPATEEVWNIGAVSESGAFCCILFERSQKMC